eukprot:26496-Alexandrium_andersonii.AAC.1
MSCTNYTPPSRRRGCQSGRSPTCETRSMGFEATGPRATRSIWCDVRRTWWRNGSTKPCTWSS